MALDRKYGRVTTEFGNIGENEPVVVFRGIDMTTPDVLLYAIQLAKVAGSPERHLNILRDTRSHIIAWQRENTSRIPTSESSLGRLAG